MNRNSGNVSKTKKLISGVGNNSKHNRKSLQNLSDSSSISSNRNSSGNSEEDVRVTNVYLKPEVDNNVSYEEQEQVTKKLQGQVKELRHKLRVLEESVDSKDYSLGAIAREKERAVGEIRRLERTNKQLRQQLHDERNHYLEEKERFCEQMAQYKKKLQESKMIPERKKSSLPSKQSFISQSLKWQHHKIRENGDFDNTKSTDLGAQTSSSQKLLGSIDKRSIHMPTFSLSDCHMNRCSSAERFNLYEGDDVSLQMAALRTENARLRSIICERDERNYELCLRFLRMKHYKNDIRSRFQDLESEYLQVIANLMDKIDEARQEFNFVIDQKFKRPLHSTNAMYLQMVQKSSRMAFENASLRLENQCLKKELSKHLTGSMELESRRTDSRLPEDELKNNDKVKRIKKNVNFNEIQTIYERDLLFKNSDTDSNYMSKSSTGPSNASLVDPKSNESIAKEEENVEDINFQTNELPDEILNKLFKRIDSGTSQGTGKNNSRRKEKGKSHSNDANDSRRNIESSVETVEKEPIIVERKSALKITDSSSPCESKESIQIYMKEASKEAKKEVKRNQSEMLQWTLRYRFNRRNIGFCSDSNPEYGLRKLEFPLRKIVLFSDGKRSGGKKQRTNRDISRSQTFRMASNPADCCGLQEKVEFSDLEFSSVGTVDNLTRTGEKPDSSPQVIEMIDCEDEDLPGEEERLQELPPAVGSRSRSSNKLNLQDELIQATNRPISHDRSWVRETRTQERVLSSNEGSMASAKEKPRSSPRGSKRFSHRLISSSPEELRNIITESQLESFRLTPIVVGHATTAVSPTSTEETDEKVLILPSPKHEQPTQTFSNQSLQDKSTVEKETSLCSINPDREKFTTHIELCNSDFRIPVSSLPTSNSTMEMVDSAAFDRGNILMRTLSAPGLLESSWLEPYNVCEMRDCGTNT